MVAWSRPAQLGGEHRIRQGPIRRTRARGEKRARSDDNKVHALFDEVRSASNRLRTGFEPNGTILDAFWSTTTASPLLLQVETKLENYVRSQRTSRGGWGRKEVRTLVYGYWAQQAGEGPIQGSRSNV